MKAILLTITLTLLFGGSSSLAATDTAGHNSKFRFAKLEATETSWDYTSLIYIIADTDGNIQNVAPSQISYVVRDKSSNPISAGKGIFVSINDTKLESEEDYSIVITARVKKEIISQTIYRKASPKKIVLKQKGYSSLELDMSRTKYSDPERYENLNVNTSSMSVDVAFTNCRDCVVRLGGSGTHVTLSDPNSYKAFETVMSEMTQNGKKVLVTLQPTISQKGNSIRYAQSSFELTPNAINEIEAEPATADKDVSAE